MTDAKRKAKLEELRLRTADIPDHVKVARLHYFMTHCSRCEAEVAYSAEVCEACGEELMENGKH